MKTKGQPLNFVDKDVGLFVSYTITSSGQLRTKLFHCITIKSVPLKGMKDIREADQETITPLNRVNWFDFQPKRKNLCPVYTFVATEKSPRIFMRLNEGSHMAMKRTLELAHA